MITKKINVSEKVILSKYNISYELIGWKGKENKENATQILKTLHRSNKFQKISHFEKSQVEWKIQIILEDSPQFSILFDQPVQPVSWIVEKRPGKYSLYILNRLVSGSTRLIFPILQFPEEIIIFKVWKGTEKKGEFHYPIETVWAFGWLSLLASPFDSRKEIKQLYSDYTLKFLKDSEKLYE